MPLRPLFFDFENFDNVVDHAAGYSFMLLNRVSVRTLDDGVAEGNVRDVFTRDRDNFTVYAGNRHLSGLG